MGAGNFLWHPSHHPHVSAVRSRSLRQGVKSPAPVSSGKGSIQAPMLILGSLNQGATLANITMKELLEAGVHFGHQTKRWNPKMKEYIFGERNGIYIIDLQKTLKLFKDAMRYVQEMASSGKAVLFVGTKRQGQEAIAEEATRCNMYYVNQRWLGGLLTNMATVQKSIKKLKELEAMATANDWEGRQKKEIV